ncbi:MAG: Omp28-related outer membrane protein [Algicola sp.]|nr:Omp28-related outer membrane protein [Algicola sp.]
MKIKSLTKVFLFVAVAALFSCSSSDENNDGGNSGPSSISVTASSQFVDFGGTVTFTVKTNEGLDVTSESTILVNSQAVAGNSFTATETGDYAVTATYGELTSSAINVNVLPVLVGIEIVPNSTTYNVGDRVEFTVLGIDNDGNTSNITSGCDFIIDGNDAFTGNVVIPGAIGSITAYATFGEFTSQTETVTVTDNASTPGTYQKKALIEDYTGTWCGYCPRVSYAIELSKEQSENVVAVGIHNGDPMANSFGSQMENAVNITGFPTAYINRSELWDFPEPSNVSQVTSKANGVTNGGIAVNTAIKGNNLSFLVSAGFGENISGAKLVVFLLESGLVYNQTNYTTYYGGGATINNFTHDHVLRHSFTSVLGDNISASDAVGGNTYRMKMDYVVPNNLVQNPSKIEIVAMLLDANGELINVNMAKAGEFSDF